MSQDCARPRDRADQRTKSAKGVSARLRTASEISKGETTDLWRVLYACFLSTLFGCDDFFDVAFVSAASHGSPDVVPLFDGLAVLVLDWLRHCFFAMV